MQIKIRAAVTAVREIRYVMKKIIAMSGGVDSSVALLLTRRDAERAGGDDSDILGVTLAMGLDDPADIAADEKNIADARSVCENQGIRHISLGVGKEFRERVISYFAESYLAGLTPNPCVVCNREIKFGLLADFAEENGADTVVTGHYARIEQIGSYRWIRKAADLTKDQSYVLAMLSQKQISMAEFPLGGLTKEKARELAGENGFVNAQRKDSQDICFIKDGDYYGYLAGYLPKIGKKLPGDGVYVDADGNVLGKNKGYVKYTIGQRKGLGISCGKHVFVLSKNARDNTVVLGDEDKLFASEVKLRCLSLPSDPHALDGRVRVTAKIRYAHRGSAGTFTRTGENEGVIEFDEPQRAPTPGQFAVMYNGETLPGAQSTEIGEYVLGAGVIE